MYNVKFYLNLFDSDDFFEFFCYSFSVSDNFIILHFDSAETDTSYISLSSFSRFDVTEL